MITLILGVFHRYHFCKSSRSASGQRENFIESLHSDDSAIYLFTIWAEKNDIFSNEIETKTISLNCFSKYIIEKPKVTKSYRGPAAMTF